MQKSYQQINRICSPAILVLSLLMAMVLLAGCTKYLDKKPIRTQIVPINLSQLDALFSNDRMTSNGPGLAELASDNYYITSADWHTYISYGLNYECLNYIWSVDAIPYDNSWTRPYGAPVYFANLVLDLLPTIQIDSTQGASFNRIKGEALFFRSFAFYELAQVYCNPFSSTTLNDPGIVLKLTSDVNDRSVRATVQQTYDRIIEDLKEAVDLLPITSTYPVRPNKVAAYAALARTYLSMRDYTNAGHYADQALKLYSTLIDYNTLLPVGSPPIKTFNAEVIFHSAPPAPSILSPTLAKVDSTLYESYDINDLRKTVFFLQNTNANAGTYAFRGSYHGSNGSNGPGQVFDGLTTDELYLTRAECAARAGLKDSAMADLNRLIIKRWSNSVTWVPFTAIDAADALIQILTERRKELIFRGQRWSDLRRFNLEGANITLKRIIDGVTYTLPPGDPRWLMQIPYDVIRLSGIAQNPRQ